MWGIISAFLPLALKAVSFFIGQSAENSELRKKYIEFLESSHNDNGNPVNMMKEIERQKILLEKQVQE